MFTLQKVFSSDSKGVFLTNVWVMELYLSLRIFGLPLLVFLQYGHPDKFTI